MKLKKKKPRCSYCGPCHGSIACGCQPSLVDLVHVNSSSASGDVKGKNELLKLAYDLVYIVVAVVAVTFLAPVETQTPGVSLVLTRMSPAIFEHNCHDMIGLCGCQALQEH
jgi:hypothetical protein